MSKEKTSFGQSDIVRLSDEDAAVELLERAVAGLWDVVNELTRFRRTTRQNYRVTIFGSARLKRATPVYNGVKKLAAELTKMGCDIISGGGPGLMQAANEGAHSVHPKALKRSVGIRIALPFEQEVNPFVGQAYEHRTFFSRLHHFMIMSDASLSFPAVSELSWSCRSHGNSYKSASFTTRHLILVGKMWAELVEWGRRSMLQKGNELASEIDFKIPHCVNTMDECIALIRENRDAWLAAQTIK